MYYYTVFRRLQMLLFFLPLSPSSDIPFLYFHFLLFIIPISPPSVPLPLPPTTPPPVSPLDVSQGIKLVPLKFTHVSVDPCYLRRKRFRSRFIFSFFFLFFCFYHPMEIFYLSFIFTLLLFYFMNTAALFLLCHLLLLCL